MNLTDRKPLGIAVLVFAVIWPVVMMLASGQPPSWIGWLVAVALFGGVSAAAYAWRRARSNKDGT